jgi:hypothetical protein
VTVVQEPATAHAPQMILSALKLRPPDHVLSLDGIAAMLSTLSTTKTVLRRP